MSRTWYNMLAGGIEYWIIPVYKHFWNIGQIGISLSSQIRLLFFFAKD